MGDELSYVLIIFLILLTVCITVFAVKEHNTLIDTKKNLKDSELTNVELQSSVDKLTKNNVLLSSEKSGIEIDKTNIENRYKYLKKNVATIKYENNKLNKINGDLSNRVILETHENNRMKYRTNSLGVSYKSNNAEVYEIMNNIQALLKTVQISKCNEISGTFEIEKNTMIEELIIIQNRQPSKKLSCKELEKQYEKILNIIPELIKLDFNPNITPEEITKIKEDMRNIYASVRKTVCINGFVDLIRLDNLLTNIFYSVCYSTVK